LTGLKENMPILMPANWYNFKISEVLQKGVCRRHPFWVFAP